MKKVGAFLLILLCVLTCVVTTLGDYLYGAVFGQTNEETAGTQYALSMDENGIVYYIENVDGANHIVKVDDQGNLIVDEELPVLTDADRFVVQNIYVTSDNYIYVAGFEMDLVNRQASRAILIALDENGSLYATPYDRTIVPEGVRAPRDGAMFAAMSEDDDRVYFAYLNEGQAEVLAHEKSDGSVTTLSYVDAGGEITAMYVTAEGRLVTADAQGALRLSSADGARMDLPAPDKKGGMPLMQALAERHSSKSGYTGAPLSAQELSNLLWATWGVNRPDGRRTAPSAMNRQPWAFVVVDDKALLQKFADSLQYAKMAASAPLAVVVCADLTRNPGASGDWGVMDASAASENLLLAAHAVGLGAVWTGVYPRSERVKAVRTILGLPESVVPLNVIPIGYPAQTPEPKQKWNPGNIRRNGWTR